jgi:hypothetical protein
LITGTKNYANDQQCPGDQAISVIINTFKISIVKNSGDGGGAGDVIFHVFVFMYGTKVRQKSCETAGDAKNRSVWYLRLDTGILVYRCTRLSDTFTALTKMRT